MMLNSAIEQANYELPLTSDLEDRRHICILI